MGPRVVPRPVLRPRRRASRRRLRGGRGRLRALAQAARPVATGRSSVEKRNPSASTVNEQTMYVSYSFLAARLTVCRFVLDMLPPQHTGRRVPHGGRVAPPRTQRAIVFPLCDDG